MDSILFSLGTVGPVFLIIAIGVLLRRTGLVDSAAAGSLTRLVFHIFLPALILKALITVDFRAEIGLSFVLVVWGALAASFVIAWLAARIAGAREGSRGFFASGSTWGNVAIVGYALGEALYGEEGLARATIVSALVLPLNTPIGYLAMDRHPGREGEHRLLSILRRLATNPVILSIVAGFLFNLIRWTPPKIAMDVLAILGRASLPLALVAIGASLEFNRDPAGWVEPMGSALVKLVVMPAFAYLGARIAGLSDPWTGTVVLAFACPTAVSFFVISRSLGYAAPRGAAVVTITTVGAAVTVGVVAALLKAAGLA